MRRKSGAGGRAGGEAGNPAPDSPAATVDWSALTADERTALKRLNRGPYPGLDAVTAERLLALGLVASRPAGVGISRAGRELVIATLLAARLDHSGEPT
ncbi:MAG: hypothetical protein J0I98_05125 [Mesorhizobium sp.]|nr:hypothetical protein [Mesorhizobium sp.]MBN9242155.1 hypothetical protein [Mesorhizobium sp.]